MAENKEISATAAKELLLLCLEQSRSPRQLAEERGLRGALDEAALQELVTQVLAAHPDKVEQLRGGKTGLMGFLVGQVVKASGGKASAAAVSQLLSQRLS